MAFLKRITGVAGLAVAAGYVHAAATRWLGLRRQSAQTVPVPKNPAELPWRGWRRVLWSFVERVQQARVMSLAGAVAFFTLLSLVPALSLLITIYRYFTDPLTIASQLYSVTTVFPEAARELIREQATRLGERDVTELSFTFFVSLGVAIWSANAAVKAIFDALNIIYGAQERRSFVKLNLVTLMTTLSAVVLLVLALTVIASLPLVTALFPFGHELETLIRLARWPVFFMLGTVSIAMLYWIGPSRRPPRFTWVLPGAIAAALLWVAASVGFSWYVSRLGNYTATYGSLATVVVFMTWLWLSATIVLAGAELNAELELQTKPPVGEARRRNPLAAMIRKEG